MLFRADSTLHPQGHQEVGEVAELAQGSLINKLSGDMLSICKEKMHSGPSSVQHLTSSKPSFSLFWDYLPEFVKISLFSTFLYQNEGFWKRF